LPPLEAMSKSCPVVSSNQGSLPEILGHAALYFNPSIKEEFINRVKDVLTNEQLRTDLIQKGLVQSSKYDWKRCAQETFDIYKSVINE
jgi:glycosyltransferase involved in cell wall biosynthesis